MVYFNRSLWVFNRFVIGFLLFCLLCVEENLRSAPRHAYSYYIQFHAKIREIPLLALAT